MNPTEDFSNRIEEAIKHPKNLGELDGADAVGTVGSEDCGDMLRMWVKFKEVNGKRVIDKAIAVASVATELISGKTVEEALTMDGAELSAPLGPLPPLKIHCAQLVEEALRSALAPDAHAPEQKNVAPTLLQRLQAPAQESQKLGLRPSNE